MKTIDKIWLERKSLLDKLYADVKCLVKWHYSPYVKVGMWERVFDRFVLNLRKQDYKVEKLIK